MLDQSLYENHSYSNFVLLPMIKQKTMIIDTEVAALHVTTLTTKRIHKIDIVLHLEVDLVMTKVLPLHTTLDHDMILTTVIQDLTVLHTDRRIDLLIDTTLVLDINHVPIQKTVILLDIQIHIDHLVIVGTLDLVHTPILETKLI